MKLSRKYLYISSAVILSIILVLFFAILLADRNIKPDFVRITNLTDTGATVTWYTEEKTIGKVYIQEESSESSWTKLPIFSQLSKDTFYDDRDIEQSTDPNVDLKNEWTIKEDGLQKRNTHHVTLRNLKPDTEYKFRMGGVIKTITIDKDGEDLTTFTTQELIDDIKIPDPAYGKVEGVSDNVSDTIIFGAVTDSTNTIVSSSFSTTLSDSSTYSIDLNLLKNNIQEDETEAGGLSIQILTKEAGQYSNIFKLESYQPLDTIKINSDSTGENINYSPLVSVVNAAEFIECSNPDDYQVQCTCPQNNAFYGCIKNADWATKFVPANGSCNHARGDSPDNSVAYLDCPGVADSGYTNPADTVATGDLQEEYYTGRVVSDNVNTDSEGNRTCDPLLGETAFPCSCGCVAYSVFQSYSISEGIPIQSVSCSLVCDKLRAGEYTVPADRMPSSHQSSLPQASGASIPVGDGIVSSPDTIIDPFSNNQVRVEVTDPDCPSGWSCNDTCLDFNIYADITRAKAYETNYCDGYSQWRWVTGGQNNSCGGSPSDRRDLNTGFCPTGTGIVFIGVESEYHKAGYEIDLEMQQKFGWDAEVVWILDSCKKPNDSNNITHCNYLETFAYTAHCYGSTASDINFVFCDSDLIDTTNVDRNLLKHEVTYMYFNSSSPVVRNAFVSPSDPNISLMTCGQAFDELVSEANSNDGGNITFVYNNTQGSGSTIITAIANSIPGVSEAQVRSALTGNDETTLKAIATSGFCDNIDIVQTKSKLNKGLDTFAQEETDNEVVTQTYEAGQYAITSNLDSVKVKSNKVVISESNLEEAQVYFFLDNNSDGVKQDDEPLIDKPTSISIEKTAESFTYRINPGWNLISLPFVSNQFTKASELLGFWNDNGIQISSIAKFDNGNFVTYIHREEETYSNDFHLVPGDAYFIKNLGNTTQFSLTGNEYQELPLDLSNGWNLVNIYSKDQDYTADSFIDECIAQDFQADIVSRYTGGLYDSVIKENDLLYGNDFHLFNKAGYFVRVTSGAEEGKQMIP